MMDYAEVLLSLSEVSATFSGFAALVTLFSRRRLEGAGVHDLMRLRLVIGASVIVIVAALVPIALAGLEFSWSTTWRLSALIFQLLIAVVVFNFVSTYRHIRGAFPPDKVAVCIAVVLEGLVQVCLLLIVFGWSGVESFGLYVSALVITLAQASFVFLRLVESSFSSMIVRSDNMGKVV
jgi:hypothetical protein